MKRLAIVVLLQRMEFFELMFLLLKGSLIGICGGVGSGKSSLLQAILAQVSVRPWLKYQLCLSNIVRFAQSWSIFFRSVQTVKHIFARNVCFKWLTNNVRAFCYNPGQNHVRQFDGCAPSPLSMGWRRGTSDQYVCMPLVSIILAMIVGPLILQGVSLQVDSSLFLWIISSRARRAVILAIFNHEF